MNPTKISENRSSLLDQYISNIHSYETEWLNIGALVHDKDKLTQMGISGTLKTCKIRTIFWNIYLKVLKGSQNEWVSQKREQRRVYQEIKDKHNLNPHILKAARKLDNPLSQEKDSTWHNFFCDEQLSSVIKQDVIRTNPNVDFFRDETIQELMINILFCYARECPQMCYRQGLHEILAPLVFVIHSDHQNLSHIQEMTNNVDPILTEVLDPKYLEADAYQLFCKMMISLELFYRINNMVISETGQLIDNPSSPDSRSSEIEVVNQLNIIRDKILAKEDLHLHNHLLKLDIPLSLFGIRWLRLLFGREFSLQDVLILWDAIFAIGNNLKLTYYVLVAMLIRVRERVLCCDYTECLTLLMRYPQNVDIMLIIQHSLYMMSPEKYKCPPNAIVYVSTTNPQIQQRSQISIRRIPPTTSNLALATSVIDYRVRSNSLPRKGKKTIESRANHMRHASAKSSLSQNAAVQEDGVVEGFRVDDPKVLRMELEDAYNLMAVSRMKLIQYLKIMRKHIPRNQRVPDELHQAVDGVEELCSLLKMPKYQCLFNNSGPVDKALEASDEATEEPTISIRRQPPNTLDLVHTFAPEIVSALNSRYEVPDNRINKNASRLFTNNSKEVEMNVFHEFKKCVFDESNAPASDPAGDRRNSD